jgi:hypothetical protein
VILRMASILLPSPSHPIPSHPRLAKPILPSSGEAGPHLGSALGGAAMSSCQQQVWAARAVGTAAPVFGGILSISLAAVLVIITWGQVQVATAPIDEPVLRTTSCPKTCKINLRYILHLHEWQPVSNDMYNVRQRLTRLIEISQSG